MSKPPKAMSAASSPAGGGDFNEEITFMIITGVGVFLIFASFKFLAWLSIYLYTPFTYLPLKALLSGGPLLSSAVFLVYAALCIGLHFLIGLRYKKAISKGIKPERSYGFLYLAGYWVIIAIYVLFKPKADENGFFEMVYYICQPENYYAPFATCTANLESVVLRSSFFSIMAKSFMPNLVFIIPIIPEIVGGLLRTVDHPKNNAIGPRTVEQFIDISKVNFPHLHFYSKIDPRKYSQDKGIFRVLRQSRQFAGENGLIEDFIVRPNDVRGIRSIGDKQSIPSTEQALSHVENDKYIPVVNAEKFEHIMLKQLGPVWKGDIDELTPEQIMLMAIVVPQCCTIEQEMSSEEASEILSETKKRMDGMWIWLASCLNKNLKTNDLKTWPDGYDLSRLPSVSNHPDYDKFKIELQNKWFKHPVMQRIFQKHAYVNTIIYEVIMNARMVGVLQPSSTRWLRLYDRELFALVQNVGRPSVFAENMASVSHYYAEKRNKQRLLRPEFQAAYSGFSERLSSFLYTKEDVDLFRAGKLRFVIEFRRNDEKFEPVGVDDDNTPDIAIPR